MAKNSVDETGRQEYGRVREENHDQIFTRKTDSAAMSSALQQRLLYKTRLVGVYMVKHKSFYEKNHCNYGSLFIRIGGWCRRLD